MSGYCPDCGNVMCVCDLVKQQELANASMPEIRYIREGEVEKMLRQKDQEIERLKEELKAYEFGHKGACLACERTGELNVELEKKLEIAVEALRFYDGGSSHYSSRYEWGDAHHPESGTETLKSGTTARKALEKIEGDK